MYTYINFIKFNNLKKLKNFSASSDSFAYAVSSGVASIRLDERIA